MNKFILLFASVVIFSAEVHLVFGDQNAPLVESLDIAKVWSGHPIGFCLFTKDGHQFAAYYDDERRMTIAARTLDSPKWDYQILPETLGWDSHNYVTLAIDDNGHIHLSGNMHNRTIVYFRTTKPYDIHSFERIQQMVGRREKSVTYPRFFRGPGGEFIYTYRDGGSGQGDQLYNVYDLKTKGWRRLLDTPLTDGQGKVNAYLQGPVRGPEGYFHLVWVWRDHGGCESNHDLCYVRSKDMIHWETATGQSIELPVTVNTKEIVVDPVPVKGGMINNNTKIGFDSQGRVILSYHKFDENGTTQIYNARLEEGHWKIYQTSTWNYRWYFQGGGAIHFEIRVFPVVLENGILTQQYHHDKYGSGIWVMDEETLKPLGQKSLRRPWPKNLANSETDFPGMQVHWRGDSGQSPESGLKYFIRWETLAHNRDRPRKQVPPPTTLKLYQFKSKADRPSQKWRQINKIVVGAEAWKWNHSRSGVNSFERNKQHRR